MRLNDPITDREIDVPEGKPLVSKTDTAGRITFANQAFVAVSGYSVEELIGAPHNLVRHPHMPVEAFADLWATIKAERPWEGTVKNRSKAGDFYWVRANVTPVVEDGEVTGYISIRTTATRQQIDQAESAYRMLRDGEGQKIGLQDGMLFRRTASLPLRSALASIKGRLAVAGGLCALIIGVVGWLGLQGMSLSNQALQQVYQGSAVETAHVTDIRAGMRGSVQLVTLMALELRNNAAAPTSAAINSIRTTNNRVDALLRDYLQSDLPPVQTALAHQLVEQRSAFVQDGLLPAIKLAEQGDGGALDQQLHARVIPLFEAAAVTNNKLVELQVKQAKQAFLEATNDFRFRFWAAIGMMIAGGAILAALGITLVRVINNPLRQLAQSFDAIGRNDLKREIQSVGAGEFRHIVGHLRAMRAKLVYTASEREEAERRAHVERRDAVMAMAETVEQEARHAMERVASDTGEMARQADGMAELTERVSSNARSVTRAAGQALANAQAVGAASEELTASIGDIASQIGHATAVAEVAVSSGERAQQRIELLSAGALRIGDVVQLIRSIAGQTNLLALNATIEAARAGEAGRGFNVVASEVKGLAAETARSTEEISRQVVAIQEATSGAVAVVAELGQTIETMSQVFTGVAAAIQQQAAATREIVRNVAESREAAQVVTERITEVSRDADASRLKADGIRTGSAAVAQSIEGLRGSLVQSIRMATRDADRRLHAREAADEPCAVLWNGRSFRSRLLDVSGSGARLIVPEPIPVGGRGVLVLGHSSGGARGDFEVRAMHPQGGAGVSFDLAKAPADFGVAIRRLIDTSNRNAA